jgi:choline-glycine betaine transporter
MRTWTVFYWAWWLSWAPFVGTFIARISRGRTIRQFIVGVLLIPSAASTLWFAILGGTALWQQNQGEDFSDAVAAVLLLTGGLQGLENSTIIVALPFVIVMLLLCVSLMKELVRDPAAHPPRHQLRHKGFPEAIRKLVGEEFESRSSGPNRWGRSRLRFSVGNGKRSGTDE